MRNAQAPNNQAETLRDVLEGYCTYLARNRDLANHCKQFLDRKRSNPAAAQAEAAVFSWLRAEKLEPTVFEDSGTGGPDFHATHASTNCFLVEATSLESGMVTERSRLPDGTTKAFGGSFGLITEKLKAKAKSKATQLGGQPLPTVLAITSNHAYACNLMSGFAAEYLMTSAPQINVPIGGGNVHMSTDLKDAVFWRSSCTLDAAGEPIIEPALGSIGAILLIELGHSELRVVGLLNPNAANSFDPQWLPNVPFVKYASVIPNQSITTEWVQLCGLKTEASFQYRRIR